MLLYAGREERTIGGKHSDTQMPSKILEKGAVCFERRIRVNIYSSSVDFRTSFPALTNALEQQTKNKKTKKRKQQQQQQQ